MIQYFPKPYERFGGNFKVEMDVSKSATKNYLKGETSSNIYAGIRNIFDWIKI